MKKLVFIMLLMPVLMFTTISCSYQDEIDEQAARIDSLELYNQQPVQMLKSMVYFPDREDGRIQIDGTNATFIRYRVEPKALVKRIASVLEQLHLDVKDLSSTGACTQTLTINSASADAENGILTLTVTPGVFPGDGNFATALVFNDGKGTFTTSYTNLFVVTHPTKIEISGIQDVSQSIEAGKTIQLQAVFTPTYTTETHVEWTSSNPSVATIDDNGVLKTIDNGTTTITVTSTDKPGLSASMTLTVTGGSIPLNDDGTSQNEAESRAF